MMGHGRHSVRKGCNITEVSAGAVVPGGRQRALLRLAMLGLTGLIALGAWPVAAGIDPIRDFSAAEPRWVEGEILVRYRHLPAVRSLAAGQLSAFPWLAGGAAPAFQIAGLASRHPPTMPLERRLLLTLARLNPRPVERIRAPGRSTAELMAEYRHHPDVDTVTPNYIRRIQRQSIPDDPRFHSQWALLNTGQTVNGSTGIAGADIGATRAWPLSRPLTQAVVIAVIDTGVDYRHPDLAGAMWVNPGEHPASGQDDDGNGYPDDIFGYDFSGNVVAASDFRQPPGSNPMDNDGHGTHVAGIAAATAHNAIGIAGVAPVRIMALKASPDGVSMPLDESLEAMAYAVMMKRDYGIPVAVINASFGGVGGSNRLERDLIIEAGEAGIVVCAAAGNDGANNDTFPFYPASYRLSNLVAVAASNQRDELAAFSNYGTDSVHLAAPGVNIVSSMPTWLDTRATLQRDEGSFWDAMGIEFSGFTEGLTAMIMDCGIGEPQQFPPRVRGKIALIERGGGLYFHQKVRNAMQAGAVAAVIYNHQSGSFGATLVGPSDWIPALSISREDGLAIAQALPSGPVVLTLSHAPVTETAYMSWSGTSMATPFVSGAMAFMAYQYPADTVAQRIARLVETVEPLPGLTRRVRSGGRLDLHRAVDRDADGLPDWWEFDKVGNLDRMDHTTDTDGNGFLDWEEYRAGTDPTDPDSLLRWIEVVMLPDGHRRLTWASAAQQSYRILRAERAPRDFDAVTSDFTATPPYNTWIDTHAPVAMPVFYRIQLVEE